jgi:hypothetical protein
MVPFDWLTVKKSLEPWFTLNTPPGPMPLKMLCAPAVRHQRAAKPVSMFFITVVVLVRKNGVPAVILFY